MKIKFINHAGVICKGNRINLLMDPWTHGSAFNNSWDLLSQSCDIKYEQLTHVWISHEHPDHFSIPDIKKIIKKNPNVIFLFQSTKDKRVINFITKLGGKIVEIFNNKIYRFNNQDFIRVIKCGSIDSLCILHLNQKTIVNMNDCNVGSELYKIKNVINNIKIDCLLTQFGYASFISNPDKVEERKIAAKKKLSQMIEQILFFKPKFVIPIASYIYFSNIENFYMNDMQNDIGFIENTIKSLNFKPIVLYPGDNFEFKDIENKIAIEKYQNDKKLIKPIHLAPKFEFKELQLSSQKYCNRISDFHSKIGIYFIIFISIFFRLIGKNPFDRIILKITDLSKLATFNIKSGLVPYEGLESPDIELNSDSLKYAFDYDWGWKTLTINGRLRVKKRKSLYLGNRVFLLSHLKNNGIKIFKDPTILLNSKKRFDKLEPVDLFLEKKIKIT
jgi:UDP-MurNAc hydroxylase